MNRPAWRAPLSPRLILFCVFLWAGAAGADDGYPQGASTLLELGRYSTHFTYPDGLHKAHMGRYGIGYYEPVSDVVTLFLQGGYATLDVDNDPVASGQSYAGRYLGVGAHWETYENDRLNLAAEMSYTWHGVSGAMLNQRSDLSWYETYSAIGPVLRFDRWRFYAGGYYQRLEGEETDQGSVNQHRNLGVDRGGGGYLGIVWYMDQTGSVGIYATSGTRQGVRLVFKRDF
ncbi:MAG TPA: hypothetical protein VLG68_00485 [Gammaproteobacteria bacterium]|nr:hypothetical protein [Gammaproteobacteria bacterium]